MAELDFNLLRDQIIGWCKQDCLDAQLKKSEKHHFMVYIKYPPGSNNTVMVYAPSSRVDSLLFGASLALNHPQIEKSISALGENVENLKYDVYTNFLSVGPRIYMTFDKRQDHSCWWVDCIAPTWIEGALSKNAVFQQVDLVSRTREAIKFFILRQLGLNLKILQSDSPDVADGSRGSTEWYIR